MVGIFPLAEVLGGVRWLLRLISAMREYWKYFFFKLWVYTNRCVAAV